MFPNFSYFQISLTFCQVSLKIWAEKSFSGNIAIWSAFYSKFVTFDASEKLRETSENPYNIFYGFLWKTHLLFRRDPQFERFGKIYCSSHIPRLLCKHFFELMLRNVSKRTNCRCRLNEFGKHRVNKRGVYPFELLIMLQYHILPRKKIILLALSQKTESFLIWNKNVSWTKGQNSHIVGSSLCQISWNRRFSLHNRHDSVEIVLEQQIAALDVHSLEILPATNIINHWWNFSLILVSYQKSVLVFCQNYQLFLYAWSYVQQYFLHRFFLLSYKAWKLFYFAPGCQIQIESWIQNEDDRFIWWRGAFHGLEEHRDLCRFLQWYYFPPWGSYKARAYEPECKNYFQILQQLLVQPKTINFTASSMGGLLIKSFCTPENYQTLIQQLPCHSAILLTKISRPFNIPK